VIKPLCSWTIHHEPKKTGMKNMLARRMNLALKRKALESDIAGFRNADIITLIFIGQRYADVFKHNS
jgi:hypothetical protein